MKGSKPKNGKLAGKRRPGGASQNSAKPLAGAAVDKESLKPCVELRSTDGFAVALVDGTPLPDEAYFWTYVVRNRRRQSGHSRDALCRQSLAFFERMGVGEDQLKEFAQRGLVEVSVPYRREESGWEARILPWESVLNLATGQWRKERRLTVVRRLHRQEVPSRPAPGGTDARLCFVASAPGALAGIYDFESEHRLISAASGYTSELAPRLNNPTPSELRREIANRKPRIVHLTGVDSHQAATLLGKPKVKSAADTPRTDAFLLADDARQVSPADASRLGEILTADGAHAPDLVGLNCYFSGSRLAAMAVARGVGHAIGFQDTADDTLAEQFFAEFYAAWHASAWQNPLLAFARAQSVLSAAPPELLVDGLVFWSGRSLIPADTTSFYHWMERRPVAAVSPPPAPSGGGQGRRNAQVPAPAPVVELFVKAQPRERLNYSLLHNNADLFTTFNIQKSRLGTVPEVEVHVELYVGETTFPFRATYRLEKLLTSLSGLIRAPLLAGVLRGRHESLQTSMFIEVLEGGRRWYRMTERVTLLPADEWTDDETEWKWLPSFVLPRDPAIVTILAHAERYLRALADDSSAGFDAYQQLVENPAVDPQAGGPVSLNPEVVDQQVRALWAALLYDTPLTYINPPPTYTQKSQRLRTPTMVLEERRGTCIDLAVLFAACLEYVGIMPVIFLVKGHAFPGYWRQPAAQSDLRNFLNTVPEQAAGAGPAGDSSDLVSQRNSWVFVGEEAFGEIARAVNAGGLVPLETVQLTQRGAFAKALELGVKNLATPWSFDALVDIQAARDERVTPLPLFQDPL